MILYPTRNLAINHEIRDALTPGLEGLDGTVDDYFDIDAIATSSASRYEGR